MSIRPVLHQQWSRLLFLHWSVPADPLRELLPPGLTLDLFQGTAYIGLIPFTITNSRASIAPPVPFLSDFHEVNVRTYVSQAGQPGVFFFSLDAASRAAVLGGRTLYKLPYHFARMEMRVEQNTVAYHSERRWPKPLPANCSIRYHIVEGDSSPSDPGTVEHFLIERYVLYTDSRRRLYRAKVSHSLYPVQRAEVEELEETLVWAAGIRKSEEAPLAHYSRGVSVDIGPLEKVRE